MFLLNLESQSDFCLLQTFTTDFDSFVVLDEFRLCVFPVDEPSQVHCWLWSTWSAINVDSVTNLIFCTTSTDFRIILRQYCNNANNKDDDNHEKIEETNKKCQKQQMMLVEQILLLFWQTPEDLSVQLLELKRKIEKSCACSLAVYLRDEWIENERKENLIWHLTRTLRFNKQYLKAIFRLTSKLNSSFLFSATVHSFSPFCQEIYVKRQPTVDNKVMWKCFWIEKSFNFSFLSACSVAVSQSSLWKKTEATTFFFSFLSSI